MHSKCSRLPVALNSHFIDSCVYKVHMSSAFNVHMKYMFLQDNPSKQSSVV